MVTQLVQKNGADVLPDLTRVDDLEPYMINEELHAMILAATELNKKNYVLLSKPIALKVTLDVVDDEVML